MIMKKNLHTHKIRAASKQGEIKKNSNGSGSSSSNSINVNNVPRDNVSSVCEYFQKSKCERETHSRHVMVYYNMAKPSGKYINDVVK